MSLNKIIKTHICPLDLYTLIVTDRKAKCMPCADLKQIHTGIYSITQYLLKQVKKSITDYTTNLKQKKGREGHGRRVKNLPVMDSSLKH